MQHSVTTAVFVRAEGLVVRNKAWKPRAKVSHPAARTCDEVPIRAFLRLFGLLLWGPESRCVWATRLRVLQHTRGSIDPIPPIRPWATATYERCPRLRRAKYARVKLNLSDELLDYLCEP